MFDDTDDLLSDPMADSSATGDDAASSDDSAAPMSDDSATPAAGSFTDNGDGSDSEFVEYVVKQIVDNPDQVEVARTVDEMGVLVTLKVAKEDMGKIIGKDGQTAKAIRILLRIIGSKNNARVNLKIIEPEEL